MRVRDFDIVRQGLFGDLGWGLVDAFEVKGSEGAEMGCVWLLIPSGH